MDKTVESRLVNSSRLSSLSKFYIMENLLH